MEVRRKISPFFSALLASSGGSLIALFSSSDFMDDRSSFTALTLLLLTYLWFEIVRLRRDHGHRWLLNPVVMCSVMTFVMGYGVTNLLFFVPADQLDPLGLVPEVTPAMVKLMWLALLGAIAMWLGYWSPVAAQLSSPRLAARVYARLLPKTNSLKPLALPVLLCLSVGARLLQIRLGVFGYSSTYDRLIEMGAITQYLSLTASLGRMALVLAALQYYSSGKNRRAGKWVLTLLAVEVAAGVLSGFKSAVVMPFLIVAICNYLRTGKLSKYWAILMFASLIFAYAVIEPFRMARNEDVGVASVSLSNIVVHLIGSSDTGGRAQDAGPTSLLALASRTNQSYIGSFAIAFSDETHSLPAGSPSFLKDILLAPLYAWIPRLIWGGKPVNDLGLWYTQVVLGLNHLSSTAMGPFAYLYFSGGFLAVFLGFFFVGIVQRSLFFLLRPTVSHGGGVVFLVMLAHFAIVDSSFNGVIVALFRDLPLILLLQILVFRKRAACLTVGATSSGAPAELRTK